MQSICLLLQVFRDLSILLLYKRIYIYCLYALYTIMLFNVLQKMTFTPNLLMTSFVPKMEMC